MNAVASLSGAPGASQWVRPVTAPVSLPQPTGVLTVNVTGTGIELLTGSLLLTLSVAEYWPGWVISGTPASSVTATTWLPPAATVPVIGFSLIQGTSRVPANANALPT